MCPFAASQAILITYCTYTQSRPKLRTVKRKKKKKKKKRRRRLTEEEGLGLLCPVLGVFCDNNNNRRHRRQKTEGPEELDTEEGPEEEEGLGLFCPVLGVFCDNNNNRRHRRQKTEGPEEEEGLGLFCPVLLGVFFATQRNATQRQRRELANV